MKVSYEIHYHNTESQRMQYNTFHHCSLEESINKLKEKGFDKSSILKIKKKTEEVISTNEWINI